MAFNSLFSLSLLGFALAAPATRAPFPSQEDTCSSESYELVKNDNGTWPYRKYKSTNATSQEFAIHQNGPALSSGLIFLTLEDVGLFGYDGLVEQSATIMSQDGELVWSMEGVTSNLRTQIFRDEPVLTVWTGSGSAAANGGAAHGHGIVNVFDSHYDAVYTVCPKATDLSIMFPPGQQTTCVADIHESYITDRNTMLVTVYNISRADLTSIGGPSNGYLTNSLAVEVDIETSEVIWSWNPQDYVPLNASHQQLEGTGNNASNAYDWFHMNSIQSFNNGYLINSRQTWTSYFVNKNGNIEWELNGQTGGDFGSLPVGYNFSFQHDARLDVHADGKILYTCFNDFNGSPLTHNPSNGIALILDVPSTGKKSLAPGYRLTDPSSNISAFAEGSHSILENGNRLMGYGVSPFIKEFGPAKSDASDSNVVWSAQFAYNNLNNSGSSYRAYKQAWSAIPSAALDLTVAKALVDDKLDHCAQGSTMRGYVSWNGATDVTQYAIYTGSSASDTSSTSFKVDKKGFETEFVVPKAAKAVQVAAVVAGKEVGRSKVVLL